MSFIRFFGYLLRTNQSFALAISFALLTTIYVLGIKFRKVFFTPAELVGYFNSLDVSIKSALVSGGITFISLLLTLYFGRKEWERQTKIKEKIELYNKVAEHVFLLVKSIDAFRKQISGFGFLVITSDDYDKYSKSILELNEKCLEMTDLATDTKFIENKNVYEMVDSIYSKGDFRQISKIIDSTVYPLTAKITDMIILMEDNKEDLGGEKEGFSKINNEMDAILKDCTDRINDALLHYAFLMKDDLYSIKGIVRLFREKND